MRMRTTFWLLVAVLFTGAFYAFVVFRDRASSSGSPAEGVLLLKLDPDTTDLLKVETAAWQVECRKVKGHWRLVSPLQGAADVGVVERILVELSLLPREEVATPAQIRLRGLTLTSYGLDAPSARITVRSGSALPVTVLVGALAPFPSSLFVKRVDEPDVITTRTNILAALPRDVVLFRDRRLFEGDVGSVVRVDLERRNGGFVQMALENGEWRIRQPFADRADGLRVQALLRDLLATEVEDVISAEHLDPAAYGLGPDAVESTLTIWMSGEETGTRVELGRAADPGHRRVCARIGGTGPILVADTNLFGLLSFRGQDFRDRSRLRFDPDAIRGVSLEAGELRMAARRAEGVLWQLTEPIQARGDAERIRTFLNGLTGLMATGFEEGAGLLVEAPPLCQARLWTGDVSPTSSPAASGLTLRVLGAVSGEDRYRADTGTGVVFFVAGAEVRRIFGPEPFWEPLRFRDREMLSLNRESIKRITLTRGEVEQRVDRDDKGRWLAHDGRAVRNEAVESMAGAAAALRAIRLENPDPGRADGYGFQTPAARIGFGLGGGEGIQKTLIIGLSDAEGNRYVQVQGQDLLFLISPAMAEILMCDLLQ